MPPRLQLVIPCFNEASRFRSEAFLELVASRSDAGVLFVDDGSTDDTAAILAGVVTRGAGRIRVVTLQRNVGKARAVQRGVQVAFEQRPEFVGYWDADLSTPLAALPEFIDVLEANPLIDIVMGSRVKLLGRHIDRRMIRHYCGRLFATAASLALRTGVYDTQCGAKIFRVNESVRQAFSAPFQSRWIVDVEILARYIAANGPASAEARIFELPLRAWTDVPGSNLGAWDAVRAVWDLALIARRPARQPRMIGQEKDSHSS
jgi:dolichyl-phosphate beta-glucosyltransferase